MENNNYSDFDPAQENQPNPSGENINNDPEKKQEPEENQIQHPSAGTQPVYRQNLQPASGAAHYDAVSGMQRTVEEHRKKSKKRGLMVFTSIILALVLLFTGAITGVTIVDHYRSSAVPQNSATAGSDLGSEQNLPKDSAKLQINGAPKTTTAATSTGIDQGLDTSVIAQKVTPSVVGVVSQNTSDPMAEAQGSGIVMTADGYIITNNHVIDGANKITVILEDGNKYDAKVIGKDAKTDLAVLKINASNLTAAEFGNSDELKVGDKAVAIGNPMGMELQGTVTQGIISAINRDITVEDRVMTLLQTDASINPGNSGGPLVNKYGQVIGINTVKISVSNYEGLGFAIPMNTAKPVIDALIAYGYIKGRPAIGISGRDMTERAANYYGVPMGVLVDTVDPKSDAYQKGLKAQDIIYGVNGKTVTSMTEIQKVKDGMKVGESLTLNVYRNGNKLAITVALVDESTLSGSSSSGSQIKPDIIP